MENPFKQTERAETPSLYEKKERLKNQLKTSVECLNFYRKTVESIKKDTAAERVDQSLDNAYKKIADRLPPSASQELSTLKELEAELDRLDDQIESINAVDELIDDPESEMSETAKLLHAQWESTCAKTRAIEDNPYVLTLKQVALMGESLKKKFRVRQALERTKDNLPHFIHDVNKILFELNEKGTDTSIDENGVVKNKKYIPLETHDVASLEFGAFDVMINTHVKPKMNTTGDALGVHHIGTPISLVWMRDDVKDTQYHEHVHNLTMPGIRINRIDVADELSTISKLERMTTSHGASDEEGDPLISLALEGLERISPAQIINQQHHEFVAALRSSQLKKEIVYSAEERLLHSVFRLSQPQNFNRFATAGIRIDSDIRILEKQARLFQSKRLRDEAFHKADTTSNLFRRVAKNIDTACLVAKALPNKNRNFNTIEMAATALKPTQYNHLKYALAIEHGEYAERLWGTVSIILSQPQNLSWLREMNAISTSQAENSGVKKILKETLTTFLAALRWDTIADDILDTGLPPLDTHAEFVSLILTACKHNGVTPTKHAFNQLEEARRCLIPAKEGGE